MREQPASTRLFIGRCRHRDLVGIWSVLLRHQGEFFYCSSSCRFRVVAFGSWSRAWLASSAKLAAATMARPRLFLRGNKKKCSESGGEEVGATFTTADAQIETFEVAGYPGALSAHAFLTGARRTHPAAQIAACAMGGSPCFMSASVCCSQTNCYGPACIQSHTGLGFVRGGD